MMKISEKMSNRKEAQCKGQVQADLSPLDVSTNTGPVTVSYYVSFRELLLEEDPNWIQSSSILISVIKMFALYYVISEQVYIRMYAYFNATYINYNYIIQCGI